MQYIEPQLDHGINPGRNNERSVIRMRIIGTICLLMVAITVASSVASGATTRSYDFTASDGTATVTGVFGWDLDEPDTLSATNIGLYANAFLTAQVTGGAQDGFTWDISGGLQIVDDALDQLLLPSSGSSQLHLAGPATIWTSDAIPDPLPTDITQYTNTAVLRLWEQDRDNTTDTGSVINIHYDITQITPTDDDDDGYTVNQGDCNDKDDTVYPDAQELCDNIDNDCNGEVDDILNTYWVDGDSDGYGDPAFPFDLIACSPPIGYSDNSDDCNDSCAECFPGNTEVCDEKDNNCDGQVDEGVTNTYFLDSDGDGFGDPSSSTQACSAPTGYVVNNTDCDDADTTIHPEAIEILNNGVDEDCNGADLIAIDIDPKHCPNRLKKKDDDDSSSDDGSSDDDSSSGHKKHHHGSDDDSSSGHKKK